jgi:hypothetical protein
MSFLRANFHEVYSGELWEWLDHELDTFAIFMLGVITASFLYRSNIQLICRTLLFTLKRSDRENIG